MDIRSIITQAKRNYVTSISTTNQSQYTEIHLPMISTIHYDYTLNICSRKIFQNSKSYLLILRCHMFNGPVRCQAGGNIQLQCQGLCAAKRGKYTTQVPGPLCCQGLCVARACVLSGPVCCRDGRKCSDTTRRRLPPILGGVLLGTVGVLLRTVSLFESIAKFAWLIQTSHLPVIMCRTN